SSSQMRPLVGSIIRLIIRRLVVLPQPDGPTRTVIWPDGASRSRWSTATVPSGYILLTASNRIMAIASWGVRAFRRGHRRKALTPHEAIAMIRFEAVSKIYPDGTVAVDHLDLEAPSGQITVLVGPSGCGKTTSLRMINRMIEPTSGRIWLDDRDTATVPPAQLRRGIGYVIQHAGLFPHRTIVDNIATVPFLLGQDKHAARRRAMDLLEQVGLPASFATRYPAQLSGGQQQRVGVARALAADPPVMLM